MTLAERMPRSRSQLWVVGLALLLMCRLPSLVAPAGGDQNLYMYVADRILAGGAPYTHAWDQKPPGVHLAYAAVRAVWPHSSAVAALDLAATALTALLLVLLGRRLLSARAGYLAASGFVVFGDPAIARLDGLYLRGQCEVLIALVVTATLWHTWQRERHALAWLVAGVGVSAAFWLKYNAVAYAIPIFAAAMVADGRPRLGAPVVQAGLGALVVTTPILGFLWSHGALTDLWIATIDYNLAYSGDTYAGGWLGALRYAVMFPIHRMRMDFLWFLGGLGVVLAITAPSLATRTKVVLTLWMGAALASILINGARDLPQYFVQAKPALALAFGLGVASLATRARLVTIVAGLALVLGLWKVGTDAPGPLGLRWGGLPQAVDNVRFDVAYATGAVDRRTYLARFKGQQKYDALEADDLATLIRGTTRPDDAVFVFGFSPSVYLESGRRSASRFFWSRPVVIEFAADQPGYGSEGLLADLARERPAVVALQKHDWGPVERHSHDFMLTTPRLRAWLDAGYTLERDTPFFSIWRRKA